MSAITSDPSTITNPQSATQQESRPPLRRATYVHVSDLTNVYNIDHAILDQELSRVKAEREQRIDQEAARVAALAASVDSAVEATELDSEVSPQKRLQPPKSGYNLCVLVGKVTIVVDKKRVDQSRVRLAEVEVGDETGIVSLRARDDQIDLLEEVSSRDGAIVLRNCTLELYQGKHIRLAVTKWGKLSLYPDNVVSTPPPPSKMNLDRDYSSIDLSVVASEMAEETLETFPHAGRQAKQHDTDATTLSTKSTGQTAKHPQPPTRRGGREKRQPKSKQGTGRATPQPAYYGLYPYEHATIPPRFAGQMTGYPSVHTYPPYDQSLDPLHQYHYAQHQEQHIMTPVSSQHVMMQRQFELQHQQLHHMYQGQQDQQGSGGMSQSRKPQIPGIVMQPVVPAASFDANEYIATSYSSTASSPILMPVAMTQPFDHSRIATADLRKRGDSHSSSSIAQETHTTQYMSVSPDDSSQLSVRMNPDASTFAPGYLGAAQAAPANPMYYSIDPSNTASGFAGQRDAQLLYPQGTMMYSPSVAHKGKGRDGSHQDDNRKRSSTTKGKGPVGK